MCLGVPSDVPWGWCFLIFLFVWLVIIGFLDSSGHTERFYVGVKVMLLHALVLAVLGGASEGTGPAVCYGFVVFFSYLKIASKNADAKWEQAQVDAINATVNEARTYGAVNLEATGYNGNYAKFLGVFDPQIRTAQERPLYKRRGKVGDNDVFLFHSENGYWMVGSDSGTNRGWWRCDSDQTMPYTIQAKKWQTQGEDGEWVFQAVTISKEVSVDSRPIQPGDKAANVSLLMV